MALVKAGADRQKMHQLIRDHSMAAWEIIQQGGENPLVERVLKDPIFTEYLTSYRLEELMKADSHTGAATQRARQFSKQMTDAFIKN
jgi:adenylosuccinate lyase